MIKTFDKQKEIIQKLDHKLYTEARMYLSTLLLFCKQWKQMDFSQQSE